MAVVPGPGGLPHSSPHVPVAKGTNHAVDTPCVGAVHGAKAPVGKYYRPELDWLRFIAFLAVFLSHAFPTAIQDYRAVGAPQSLAYFMALFFQTGAFGLDLFFALSSFLITELLLLEKGRTGNVHVKSFYIRRILRIWPLYFAFILTVCPFDVAFGKSPILYYVAMLAFSGNWYNVFRSMGASISFPLWSVSLEEQFYIVWPNLVRRTKPNRFAAIMVLILASTILYRSLFVYANPSDSIAVWFNTFTRLDAFALGGLLAWLLHNRSLTFSYAVRVCVLATAAGLLWFVGTSPNGGHYGTSAVWAYPTVALASALCILAFVTAPPRHTYSKPFQILSYLGKISYGLYVFHYAAIVFTRQVLPDGVVPDAWAWVCRAIIAAIVTLTVSMASYEFLEKPFLRLKRRFTYVESRP